MCTIQYSISWAPDAGKKDRNDYCFLGFLSVRQSRVTFCDFVNGILLCFILFSRMAIVTIQKSPLTHNEKQWAKMKTIGMAFGYSIYR